MPMPTASRPGARRHWLVRGLALAATAWPGLRAIGATAVEERPVHGYDRILWQALGDLKIEQTGTEGVRIDAEAAVRAMILTEVHDGELRIGLAPGSVSTQEPVRVLVSVKSLVSFISDAAGEADIPALETGDLRLELNASGGVHLGRLQARQLGVRLTGSGELRIDQGSVAAQTVTVSGSGPYRAERLASRRATVRVDGSGAARLAAGETLDAQITGSGDIAYRGEPDLHPRVTGSGRIVALDPRAR